MSRSTVAGLQSALRLYESEKVRERAEGQNRIREIFSHRENLLTFQKTASRGGGAGWIAFFQCLYQAVITEKKAWLKKSAGPQAERRLADAISLVRWMAERSVRYIGRGPLISLITHMIHLLVYGNTIFQPAALDYAKGLRALLSYPPHLSNIDQQTWKLLMGTCWAALLGDEIENDQAWYDEAIDGSLPGGTGVDSKPTNGISKGKPSVISQSTAELVHLIPILLSSSNISLIPPLPPSDGTYGYEPSLGLSIIVKVVRFFRTYHAETSSHLPILRSMNVVLANLEMNCRHDLIDGGHRLLPSLVALWSMKNKAIREQVLIGFRIVIPLLTLDQTRAKLQTDFTTDALTDIVDVLEKESSNNWGFDGLEIGSVSLRLRDKDDEGVYRPLPFETRAMTAGFDFTHEQALRWAVLELYSECCFLLHHMGGTSHDGPRTRNEIQAKRRKTMDTLTSLLESVKFAPNASRLQAAQVLLLVIDRHWREMSFPLQTEIRSVLLSVLEEEESPLQAWAFIAWATIMTFASTQSEPASSISPNAHTNQETGSLTDDGDIHRLWAQSLRKLTSSVVSRAAALLASALIASGTLGTSTIGKDLGSFLEAIDIQGPPYPHDSICALLSTAIEVARQDVRLYTKRLEDKVITYLAKWNALDGTRGRGRLDQHAPADLLPLMTIACHLKHFPLSRPSTKDFLPDCAIVDRVVEEDATYPIRQFNLYGTIIESTDMSLRLPTVSIDQHNDVVFAPGASVRRVRHLLDSLMRLLFDEWPRPKEGSDAKPTIPPERCRKTIDTIVLALAFHANLQLNGVEPDGNSHQLLSRVIDLILPDISSPAYDVPARYLIWAGFQPLIHINNHSSPVWPIMLKPTSLSGVRPDLLAADKAEGDDEDNAERFEGPLLRVIWNLPDISNSLRSIQPICLELFSGHVSTQTPHANIFASGLGPEDDDFGEIRTAEADTIPLAREAIECERANRSLYDLLARIRLRGLALQSEVEQTPRDVELVNVFLQADGPKMIQLGSALCKCLNDHLIRLNARAVDSVFSVLTETSTSYAYQNDDGLLQLLLGFMTKTAHIWLAPELATNGLLERVITTAKTLQLRSASGDLPSWKCRLALLEFVDEYLDYEPEMAAWNEVSPSTMDVDQLAGGATDVISTSLLDIDIRLRVRAATSTAGLLYLTSIPVEQHGPFYHSTVDSLPREPRHWDSFLTDILWKFNCCITSPQLRAATIYHLYEISPSTKEYDSHLRIGLDTVARRLGLTGITPLYRVHAPLIVSSQICALQSPMLIPPELYGYTDTRSFAIGVLDAATPAILIDCLSSDADSKASAKHAKDVFKELCAAAGISEHDSTARHLSATTAWALTVPGTPLLSLPSRSGQNSAFDLLKTLPGFDRSVPVNQQLTPLAEDIATHAFALLDFYLSHEATAKLFATKSWIAQGAPQIYLDLTASDNPSELATPPLVPCAGAEEVLDSVDFLRNAFPTIAPPKVLLNTLILLFHRVNEEFLVNEQYRHMRTICFVISVYHDSLVSPTVLEYLLRETLSLVTMNAIGHLALAILRYAFELICKSKVGPGHFNVMMVRIGTLHQELASKPESSSLFDEYDRWLRECIPLWERTNILRPVLQITKPIWPDPLPQLLESTLEPSFSELCEYSQQIKDINIVSLCNQLVRQLPQGGVADDFCFAFWHIKDHLPSLSDTGGTVMSFLDLLYVTHGLIQPPPLDSDQVPKIKGLEMLRSRPKEDPAPFLRAAILQQIVDLTREPEFQARSTGFHILQALVSRSGDLIEHSLLPKESEQLLSLLNTENLIALDLKSRSFNDLAEDKAWIRKAIDSGVWARDLAVFISEELLVTQPFFAVLPILFRNRPASARELLPILVQSALSCFGPQEMDTLKTRYQAISKHVDHCLKEPAVSADTLRIIIDIVLHLRNFQPPYRQDDLGYEQWLDLDMMLLSEAAVKCGSFATGLMFLELSQNGKHGHRVVDLYDPNVQRIMYDVYSNVEDPDGFYGIKTYDISNALQRRLQHEGEHWRSFGLHSAALEATGRTSDSSATLLAMRDLHSLGFNQVSSAAFGNLGLTAGTKDLTSEPLLFELAWRTGDWDLPEPANYKTPESLLYSSLRAVHRERDLSVAQKVVHSAISFELGLLKDCGKERMTQIKRIVTDLLCLREVDKFLSQQVVRDTMSLSVSDDTKPNPLSGMFQELNSSFSFSDVERLTATRRSLIKAAKDREQQNFFGDLATDRFILLESVEIRSLLRLGELARAEGNIQASINAVVAVRQIGDKSNNSADAIEDEFGQVLWAQHEHVLAIQHLEERMTVLRQEKKHGSRLSILLGRAANWTTKAKLRAPNEINATFEEAVRLAHAHKVPNKEQSQLYHDYATFADTQQHALSRSPELEQLTTYVQSKSSDVRSATPALSSRRAVKSSGRTARTDLSGHLQREMMEDEQAIENILAQQTAFASTALKMYATALALSDDHDDSITRMCSLWLESDSDEKVNLTFRGPLSRVPSHKFLFLSPQLAARLDQPRVPTPFNDALNGLVLRISQQHPFHILYQVINLADGFVLPSRGKRTSDIGIEGRAPAAGQIIAMLSKDLDRKLANTAIKQMKILADSATQWCLSRDKEEEKAPLGKSIAVPATCPLRSCHSLQIPVSTKPPPIDPLCEYTGIPTLGRYRSNYSILGGIHRPKRMQVYDSTGQTHRELFKGEDELRQDAVMEQVFEMSNRLLSRDRKTQTRNLRFRTYVVIPLAKRTGIMEFVGDSQAIGDWLKPAHNRYGRIYGDIAPEEFRKTLKPMQEKEQEWDKLPKQYSNLVAQFHPVMRHFFTEKHRDPMAWFTMRLNYIRSVAVTSIVGWILGIGDRHCSNILIDQKSGELVHIDFGIVFEDGRRLRIPEKVPFRLTPDIVDGFGLTGVDGTFRRCSEHTLRVLRESSELIMTVLEVFKHDPLYAWDADPEKLQRAQGGGRVTTGTSASAIEKADRILSKIKIKLGDTLSVEYTVNQLIQEARDVDNLAKIFVGWQPWF